MYCKEMILDINSLGVSQPVEKFNGKKNQSSSNDYVVISKNVNFYGFVNNFVL